MRTRSRLIGVVLLLALALACAGNPTVNLSPEGKAAYTADQIVIRVNELQNAAIQAEAAGALPIATTRQIVQFAVAANEVLGAVPEGWPATLTTAWLAMKAALPPITNPAVAAALAGVEAVLAVYLGG